MKMNDGDGIHPIEKKSIAILFLLYVLQGIPLGLSSTMPFLLEKKISFSEQAIFAMVNFPFTLKLLWAPLLDAFFVDSFGRRKSWIVPIQLTCGIVMLWGTISGNIAHWMGDSEQSGGVVDIVSLSAYFFSLYFLMATQDIAVDGWALNLLSGPHQHLAGNLNAAGQTMGYFLSYVLFLLFHDPIVCNIFRKNPSDVPFVNLDSFFKIAGIGFLLMTTLIACYCDEDPWKVPRQVESRLYFENTQREQSGLLPTEEYKSWRKLPPALDGEGIPDSIKSVYRQFICLCLKGPIQILSLVLLGQAAAMAVQTSSLQLKVVSAGVPVTLLAALSPAFVGVGIILPIVMASIITQSNQLVWLWRAMALQICLAPFVILMPRFISHVYTEYGGLTWPLIFALFAIVIATSIEANMTTVALLSFYPSISDPAIGGTFVTFLTTLSSGSKHIVRPLCMFSIQKLDDLMVRQSSGGVDDQLKNIIFIPTGYEIMGTLCALICVCWLFFAWRPIVYLQTIPKRSWWVRDYKTFKSDPGPSYEFYDSLDKFHMEYELVSYDGASQLSYSMSLNNNYPILISNTNQQQGKELKEFSITHTNCFNSNEKNTSSDHIRLKSRNNSMSNCSYYVTNTDEGHQTFNLVDDNYMPIHIVNDSVTPQSSSQVFRSVRPVNVRPAYLKLSSSYNNTSNHSHHSIIPLLDADTVLSINEVDSFAKNAYSINNTSHEKNSLSSPLLQKNSNYDNKKLFAEQCTPVDNTNIHINNLNYNDK